MGVELLCYQTVYEGDSKSTPPLSIFVTTDQSDDALVWNQREQVWQYDPRRVIWFTADFRNLDRYDPVDRATAEEFSRKLARSLAPNGSSPSELPSEEWIEWFFSWKGDPPESEDG